MSPSETQGVAEAKRELLDWGLAAQAAHDETLARARLQARRAAPFAALAAAAIGLLAGRGAGRRRRDRQRDDEAPEHRDPTRGPSIASLVPLIVAGLKLAPTIMDALGRGRQRE